MTRRIIVGFDTSTLNRLVKDTNSEPIVAVLQSNYDVRIPEMSFGEVVATRKSELREKLVTICRRLLKVGNCIAPAHWLIDLHVKQFHDDPTTYDWRKVNVEAKFLEKEILEGTLAKDESLAEEQATELRRLQDEFEDLFEPATLATGNPKTFAEWISESKASGGSFWNTARLLYEGAFGSTSAIDTGAILSTPPDEATLKTFTDACPPMRAMVYAMELTLYDRSLRPSNVGPAYKAGRNDQMMAVYLPYCDQFLTDDGQQLKGLREVASVAGLSVNVRSYDDFCAGHMDEKNK
jgi:hypothetical protein